MLRPSKCYFNSVRLGYEDGRLSDSRILRKWPISGIIFLVMEGDVTREGDMD